MVFGRRARNRLPGFPGCVCSDVLAAIDASDQAETRPVDVADLAATPEQRFSDCGFVKRVSVVSVRGHGSLRGRLGRLMMVFGGGPSPMSFAG